MFNQTFIEAGQASKRPLTLGISLLLEVTLICLFTLIPLFYTRVLPPSSLKELLIAPTPPRAAVPEPPGPKTPAKLAVRTFRLHELYAPVAVPKSLPARDQIGAAPDIGVSGAPSDGNNVTLYGVIGSVPQEPPPPPEPIHANKPLSPGPVHIGTLSEANLVRKVVPVYPPLAKLARVQGVVEFTALISKDGNIENLKLVQGHPLLVNAAKEAVEQWKYRPTLLNGVPVEVIADIFVHFTLSQ